MKPEHELDIESVGEPGIEDRTHLTPRKKRVKSRDPATVKALVLHQMAFSRGNDPSRYDNVTAHYAILPNGRILRLHPVSALLYASNGFNTRSVAVEFAGNFPSTRGKCWEARRFGCHTPTPEQIEAGRFLIRHLIREIGLTYVYAHRQANPNRENCPGPDIWFHVGQWAVENLGLSDGGPDYKIGNGKPIPDSWRNWGRRPTSPELETFPLESEASAGPGYFKDSPELRRAPLAPSTPLAVNPRWPSLRKSLAGTYNRLGGLMGAVAARTGIEVQAVLAAWHIESGGRTHTVGRAVIRFENHLFFRLWGRSNEPLYNQHFRHGGHAGEPGRPFQNHKFRDSPREAFRSFHGNQELEYRVLALAARLGGQEAALKSISIGGPQILIANHRLIGYSSPRSMFDAFQADERWHVLGFFDYCRHRRAPHPGALLRYLRNRDWRRFAYYYNGPGQVELYGNRLANIYGHALQLPIPGEPDGLLEAFA